MTLLYHVPTGRILEGADAEDCALARSIPLDECFYLDRNTKLNAIITAGLTCLRRDDANSYAILTDHPFTWPELRDTVNQLNQEAP